tara:strand:- start:517 stop:1395 length:879 start_codon:yes stop_codon:yes gene_type:complete
MDLRVLRYFVQTVEAGSISAAAIACHVAQPSITLAIAKLEEELNCKLFERHRKGSTATADGVKMYAMAKDLLSHAQSIKNEFNSLATKETLRLYVDQNIRVSVLEGFIHDVQLHSNSVTLSLISPQNKQEQSFDMHLTNQKNIEPMDWFFPLMKENYSLIIPKSNRLAFKQNIELSDLQEQPLITRIHCENKALFEQVCRDLSIEFNSVAEVETEEWAHALVRSGLGLCFVPLPANFIDPEFEVRSLSDLLPQTLPERVVGLSVRLNSQEKVKSLLPFLLREVDAKLSTISV